MIRRLNENEYMLCDESRGIWYWENKTKIVRYKKADASEHPGTSWKVAPNFCELPVMGFCANCDRLIMTQPEPDFLCVLCRVP